MLLLLETGWNTEERGQFLQFRFNYMDKRYLPKFACPLLPVSHILLEKKENISNENWVGIRIKEPQVGRELKEIIDHQILWSGDFLGSKW